MTKSLFFLSLELYYNTEGTHSDKKIYHEKHIESQIDLLWRTVGPWITVFYVLPEKINQSQVIKVGINTKYFILTVIICQESIDVN